MSYPAILECKAHGLIGCKPCAPPVTRASVEERIRYTSEVPGASASIMADVDALVAAAVAAEREEIMQILIKEKQDAERDEKRAQELTGQMSASAVGAVEALYTAVRLVRDRPRPYAKPTKDGG